MVEFRVLKCAQCQTFQVLQVTKSQKWKCKLCGEKQSVLREYGRGTGADCRRHVQKLNTLRGTIDEALESNALSSHNIHPSSCKTKSKTSTDEQFNGTPTQTNEFVKRESQSSRWNEFMEDGGKPASGDESGDHHDGTDGDMMPSYGYDGRLEGGQQAFCIASEWSSIQKERKQDWRNKRKMRKEDDYGSSSVTNARKYGSESGRSPQPHDDGSSTSFNSTNLQNNKHSFSQQRYDNSPNFNQCFDSNTNSYYRHTYSKTKSTNRSAWNKTGNQRVSLQQAHQQDNYHDFDSGNSPLNQEEVYQQSASNSTNQNLVTMSDLEFETLHNASNSNNSYHIETGIKQIPMKYGFLSNSNSSNNKNINSATCKSFVDRSVNSSTSNSNICFDMKSNPKPNNITSKNGASSAKTCISAPTSSSSGSTKSISKPSKWSSYLSIEKEEEDDENDENGDSDNNSDDLGSSYYDKQYKYNNYKFNNSNNSLNNNVCHVAIKTSGSNITNPTVFSQQAIPHSSSRSQQESSMFNLSDNEDDIWNIDL